MRSHRCLLIACVTLRHACDRTMLATLAECLTKAAPAWKVRLSQVKVE